MPPPVHRCPFTGRALPPPTKYDLLALRRVPGGLRQEPAPAEADDAQDRG